MQESNDVRRRLTPQRWQELSETIQNPALSLSERAALRLKLFLQEETILRNPGERIPAWRTLAEFPDLYAPGEKETLTRGKYLHEQGRVCNISSDWDGVLHHGLLARYETAPAEMKTAVDAVLSYADRYEDSELSQALRHGAKTYLQALKAFRILHFALWASNVYHNTVGRFDQYMRSFYEDDRKSGRLTEEEALSLTEEFFLSFNRDSDLYTGMQQGDNGQSLMLGGCDEEGRCAVNDLTYLCLKASLHNRRIDPKINLRVDRNTPEALYELCTQLTRQGLGFPQYANDDVVIPALVNMGYDLKDARNYTVAACWEFIIPGVAMDIPNIGAISHAQIVRDVIHEHLKGCQGFSQLLEKVKEAEEKAADELEQQLKPLWMEPAPYQSVLMSDWSRDVSQGAKYNHYGIHGTGFASAVDQLAAVKKYVFEEKTVSPEELLRALDENFENSAPLHHLLREEAPKLGRDEECDEILETLIDLFAAAWEGRVNERGGRFRTGTGSAMYYLWHAETLPATADGRTYGQRLPANFSPSLHVSGAGPLSVISAMARPNVGKVCNGGPLTLEVHDTVFQHQEGLEKVARLVETYIRMGGHQLQINAVNRETLLDAQKNPNAHRGLIVRVWGWSGHFVQLDKAYQDQILERTSYAF